MAQAMHEHLRTRHEGLNYESLEHYLAWRTFELEQATTWQAGDPWPPGWEPADTWDRPWRLPE